MKEIIWTISCCNDCVPYMETDLNSGDDYCTHPTMGCVVIPDPSVIMEKCPLQDNEVLKDDKG